MARHGGGPVVQNGGGNLGRRGGVGDAAGAADSDGTRGPARVVLREALPPTAPTTLAASCASTKQPGQPSGLPRSIGYGAGVRLRDLEIGTAKGERYASLPPVLGSFGFE